jgi:AraC family transcriptional regulator, arabinose operon regulatory protein
MVKEIRYFRLPPVPDNGNGLHDLHLAETGELEVEGGTIWNGGSGKNYMLAWCTRGEGIVVLSGEQVPVGGTQFFISPPGETFKYYSAPKQNSSFLVAGFNGKSNLLTGMECSIVRNLVPSVSNMVANRELLFDEIFNNLMKGFYQSSIEYVSFCFGHLLATFVYANRNSDDLDDESNPVVHRAIRFLEKNLHHKLSLRQIAAEAGFSPTYFSTLFRKETNYAPLSYFSHLKILKACEYLDYTRMKVKDISYKLGFTDPYYFTRDFKLKMGMSPRQYRRRLKN